MNKPPAAILLSELRRSTELARFWADRRTIAMDACITNGLRGVDISEAGGVTPQAITMRRRKLAANQKEPTT